MPTYDFKCSTCDQTATLITGINRELIIPRCVKCQTDMVRDYGLLAVRFKGKGFYSNERK